MQKRRQELTPRKTGVQNPSSFINKRQVPKKPRRYFLLFPLDKTRKILYNNTRTNVCSKNQSKGSYTIGILDAIFSAAFEGETPPAVPAWIEWEHVATGMTHCPVCLKLDGCWFTDETKPMLPQHPHCHCQVNPLSFSRVLSEAKATSKYSKFDPYLFDPENAYKHGKQKMFERWGYSIDDSQWLQREFERQALDKYVSGDYSLGKLDKEGQRMDIRIEIPRKDSLETVSFISGWMVWPNGDIRLATPYGGK